MCSSDLIDSSKFLFSTKKEDFYLVLSRLLSYKQVNLIVEAFNWLGWTLLIVGDGPERTYLETKALSNIQFLGYISDELRASLMSRSSGIVIAALEDYGLVPIEANASGTPVIAYNAGGIIDTQIAGETAILFKPQTPEALIKALIEARNTPWNHTKIRDHALTNFSEKVFFQKIQQLIQQLLGESAADIFG